MYITNSTYPTHLSETSITRLEDHWNNYLYCFEYYSSPSIPRRKKYEESEPHYQSALVLLRKQHSNHGSDEGEEDSSKNSHIIQILNSLLAIYQDQGNHDKSKDIQDQLHQL